MARNSVSRIPEGKLFDDDTVGRQLEELGFDLRGKGTYVKPEVPKRGGLPARKGAKLTLRLKPDAVGQERVYMSVGDAEGAGLVYAPEQFEAEMIVSRVRQWMADRGIQ